ncbi:ABC transporter substrate-binding protein [Sinorhizobium meliloti]|uniref:ABC transporter substrate-binding protein n=1 Tax=Rhizobium meliloti TaxID=382 RepID=UPI000FD95CE9|nr:ABC transporter substrate-binding protein [Sinorhizobium meliloti]RVJ42798.1 ABC transporter substrate-binding protein [Sinorhizobium meliloti]
MSKKQRRSLHTLKLVTAICAVALSPGVSIAQDMASGVLRVGVRQEPDSMNPHTMSFSISFEIIGMIYDLLVGKNFDGELTDSGLAEKWVRSEDGLRWTVTLKPNLKWADGSPLTVADVVSSWEFVMNSVNSGVSLNGTSTVKGVVKSISVKNENTIEITTEYPTESNLNERYIVPAKLWGSIGYDKIADYRNPAPVIGSGPFILKNWAQGQSVTLERNPHFRGPGPFLQEVRLLQFANPDAAVQALRSGEVDYITDVPVNQVAALDDEPDVVAKAFESTRTVYLGFNTWTGKGAGSTTALADPAFRDALGYAIDKQAIVKRVLGGYGTPATSMLVPAYGRLYPDVSDIVRQFDLDLAKEKLAKAGYIDGDGNGLIEDKEGKDIHLRLYLPDVETTYPAVAQFLTAWFGKVGVQVNTTVVSEASLLSNVQDPGKGGGDYDMLIWFWEDVRPEFPLSVLQTSQIGGLNWSFWSDPEYDGMYQDFQRAGSLKQRAEVAEKMVRKLYIQGPYHALYYPATLHAYRTDRISGWPDSKLPPLMSGVFPNPTITTIKVNK